MRKIVFFFCAIVSLKLAAQNTDEKPANIFNVTINDVTRKVKEGETFKIGDKLIKINVSSEVNFRKGIVSFDYPQYFGYEYSEEGDQLKSWILSGNDFKVFYMIIKGNLSANGYADIMNSEIGKAINSEVQISINKNKFEGRKLLVSVLKNPFAMEIYKLKFDGVNTHFLVFQDSKKENGNDSDESSFVKEILNKTFYLH